jgi:hypothetical protein
MISSPHCLWCFGPKQITQTAFCSGRWAAGRLPLRGPQEGDEKLSHLSPFRGVGWSRAGVPPREVGGTAAGLLSVPTCQCRVRCRRGRVGSPSGRNKSRKKSAGRRMSSVARVVTPAENSVVARKRGQGHRRDGRLVRRPFCFHAGWLLPQSARSCESLVRLLAIRRPRRNSSVLRQRVYGVSAESGLQYNALLRAIGLQTQK